MSTAHPEVLRAKVRMSLVCVRPQNDQGHRLQASRVVDNPSASHFATSWWEWSAHVSAKGHSTVFCARKGMHKQYMQIYVSPWNFWNHDTRVTPNPWLPWAAWEVCPHSDLPGSYPELPPSDAFRRSQKAQWQEQGVATCCAQHSARRIEKGKTGTKCFTKCYSPRRLSGLHSWSGFILQSGDWKRTPCKSCGYAKTSSYQGTRRDSNDTNVWGWGHSWINGGATGQRYMLSYRYFWLRLSDDWWPMCTYTNCTPLFRTTL